jgi:hypothetical protein
MILEIPIKKINKSHSLINHQLIQFLFNKISLVIKLIVKKNQ